MEKNQKFPDIPVCVRDRTIPEKKGIKLILSPPLLTHSLLFLEIFVCVCVCIFNYNIQTIYIYICTTLYTIYCIIPLQQQQTFK